MEGLALLSVFRKMSFQIWWSYYAPELKRDSFFQKIFWLAPARKQVCIGIYRKRYKFVAKGKKERKNDESFSVIAPGGKRYSDNQAVLL